MYKTGLEQKHFGDNNHPRYTKEFFQSLIGSELGGVLVNYLYHDAKAFGHILYHSKKQLKNILCMDDEQINSAIHDCKPILSFRSNATKSEYDIRVSPDIIHELIKTLEE